MGSALATALLQAQKTMPPMEKDSENPHFKSGFTSLDYIITHARPAWTDAGLSVTQWPSFDEISGRHTLTTRVMEATSGEFIEDRMMLNIGKDDMQGLGAAITYARRFSLSAIFALATETDDDGNSTAKTKRSAPGNAEPKADGAGEAGKPAAAPSADGNERDPRYATVKQSRYLFKIAKENNVDNPTVKKIVEEVTGQGSTAQIPKELFDKVIVAVQTWQLATALAEAPFE